MDSLCLERKSLASRALQALQTDESPHSTVVLNPRGLLARIDLLEEGLVNLDPLLLAVHDHLEQKRRGHRGSRGVVPVDEPEAVAQRVVLAADVRVDGVSDTGNVR